MNDLIALIEEYISNNYSSKRQFCLENKINYENFIHFINSKQHISEPLIKKLCELVGYPYDELWFEVKFVPVLKEVISSNPSYVYMIIEVIKETIEAGNNEPTKETTKA